MPDNMIHGACHPRAEVAGTTSVLRRRYSDLSPDAEFCCGGVVFVKMSSW